MTPRWQHLGDERVEVDHERLAAIMAADGVTVETGDIVCMHTGLGQRVVDAAIACDNLAVEPSSTLGERWYLTELARWLREQHRCRFLLTAPPLRMPGAAGSPVTPIATV